MADPSKKLSKLIITVLAVAAAEVIFGLIVREVVAQGAQVPICTLKTPVITPGGVVEVAMRTEIEVEDQD